MDPAELRLKNFIRTEQFPYQSALGWEYDSGDYHTGAAAGDGEGRLRRAARRAEGQAGGVPARRDARADGHRRRRSSPRSSAPARRRTATSSASPCSTVARSASIRPARRSRAWAPRARARATRPPTPRSSRPRSAFPPTTIMVEEGNTDTAPYGLGTYGSRSTPVAGAAIATRRAQDQGEGADDRRLSDGSASRRRGVRHRPLPRQRPAREVQDHEGDRLGRLQRGAARTGAGAGGGELLRSAEHDLSVRRLYLRHGHRRGYRRRQDPPLLRARRLRHAHQPDDHRGPGAWRA